MVPGSNMKTIRCFIIRKTDNWKKIRGRFYEERNLSVCGRKEMEQNNNFY